MATQFSQDYYSYSMRSAVCESKFRESSSSLQMAHEERNTELQLVRVSNDAHRLTEMIDSLFKSSKLDRRVKDVARELLRGAMDLQESLVMLGKLQDASKQLAKTTKKNVAAVDGEREARRSVDGSSSRDCIDELRRVIRDSFQKHNLLSRSPEDERALSSRSMRFNPETELRDEHCERSRDGFGSNKKVKAPNLIAKLMGLEEVPLDETMSSLKPLRTPTFDDHMPKARKEQVMERSPDLQKKTLQDIIEKMQFKGILKNGQAEDFRIEPLAPNSSPLERYRSGRLHYDDEHPAYSYHEAFEATKETKTVAIGSMKIIEKPKVDYAKKFTALDSQKEQAKEEFKTHKKTVDRQKPLLTRRKSAEKEVKVRRPAALFQENTSKQSHMLEKKPSLDKSNLSAQASALQKHKSNNLMKDSTKNSSSRKKKTAEAKSVKTSAINAAIKDSTKSKDDGKVIKPLCETAAISTLVSSDLSATGETKQAEVNQTPCSKEEQKAVGEVLPKIISEERCLALSGEATPWYENKPTVREDLKGILLSSQTFLKDAQKFISPNGHQPIYRRKNIEAAGARDAKLFLDCAIELMARKSHQKELFYHSLDPLLSEISRAFEKLTTYNAIDADATYEDTLYVRLEKDLKCKDILINSMWDVGWSYCVCIEEVQQVVHIVGEFILFWLIEEIAKEILLFSCCS
ncbi:uncharacterized protein LOC120260143 [Dioscorea cayenensis subsp. rotundata]|uniref:Uncharacterized protein LOC120260143 n=1 Tax=Dioscorea cayennensis subsp. rotundata TaxID=55577 RepID=A0AB40B8C8_DIOCR|nr:uncharacterized protein LOC120260143 [Dioscorea cayenensis subsp. rotundata]